MIIRKLKQNEHEITRPLWERVFKEDTKEFLDYYYSVKTEDNDIYVIQSDGEIRSMLQLNPYLLRLGIKEEGSRYIIAVATEEAYRGKGYMTELLRKAVRDMYLQKIPFAYLMPADEKIYYPHNFRFIYAAEQWKVGIRTGGKFNMKLLLAQAKENCEKNGSKVTLHLAQMQDCKRIAQFAESLLEDRYQVYARRNWLYYETLLKEQNSQNGGILLAERNGELRGMVLYDEESGFAIREPLLAEGEELVFEEAGLLMARKRKKKPMIMARILDVESLLVCMTCKETMNLEFWLVDPVIRENNRLFIVKGNREHVVVRTKAAAKNPDVQKISIDALTTLVFGYKPIEAVEEEEKEYFSDEFKQEIAKLCPLCPISLNEIV